MKLLRPGLACVAGICCISASAQAPEADAIRGLWAGTTTVQAQEVHLLMRVEAEDAPLAVSIEGPSQGWPLLAMDDVQYDGSRLIVRNNERGISLDAALTGPDLLTASYRQYDLDFDIPMFRVPEAESLAREATAFDEIAGNWEGTIKVQGRSARLVFHVDAEGKRLTATMDSASSGIVGLAMADVRYDNGRFMLLSNEGLLGYNGIMVEPDRMMGLLKRGPLLLGLTLSRGESGVASEATVKERPQTPKPPFPYVVEEVEFACEIEGSRLTGSLTLPPAIQAVAVIVLTRDPAVLDRIDPDVPVDEIR